MAEELDKLNKTANSLGFDLSIFVGIPIAAIPLFFIFNNYQSSVLSFLGLSISAGIQETVIIFILTLISSIIIYKISGWCLDWIYDAYYKEKKNKKSELNKYIDSARKKWNTTNSIYKSVSIYKPTLEKVEKDNVNEFKKISEKLSVSKIFRIIVIPTLILGIMKMINNNFLIGIVCIVISVVCLFISFNYRAEHSKRLYRWFISS